MQMYFFVFPPNKSAFEWLITFPHPLMPRFPMKDWLITANMQSIKIPEWPMIRALILYPESLPVIGIVLQN